VRNHLPQSEFDRAWQLAALSVLEGGLDGHVLAAHLEHLGASMADEPRMQLARGIAEEQNTAPAEAMSSAARNGTAQQRAARARADHDRAIELAVAGFREAQADTTLRAEASLRLGHVLLGEGKFDEALASWTSVEDDTRDPALGYLVRLFRGIAFEGLSRPGDAGTAYRSALAVSPGGHAATMRLAALAFRNGYGEEAGHLLDTLIADDDPSRDFWWEYYTADWRFWFPRIARVRILLAGHSGAPAARQP
jgi:predicted negative regulator of RcsB-dependent stress response